MVAVMNRMYEKNDPHIFWNRVRYQHLTRPYSGGSKNAPSYPTGVFYEGITEMDEHVVDFEKPEGMDGTWRKYAGASAGQSPLIHALDISLGVEHGPMAPPVSPTKASPSSPTKASPSTPLPTPATPTTTNGHAKVNPMLEMREYLPHQAKAFLHALQNAPSIRTYLISNPTSPCVAAFNDCLLGMKKFRDVHLKITTVYIISQQAKEHSKKSIGTGGTELIPFLKQTRQETMDSWVGDREI
jgi:indoleamine 2,3-dioxygenase